MRFRLRNVLVIIAMICSQPVPRDSSKKGRFCC